MDAAAIEVLCDDLGVKLPDKIARPKATLERLQAIDVMERPMPDTVYLAAAIRGQADRGEKIDPLALVRAAREAADSVEAAKALQMAVEDALRYYELAFRGGGGLMPVVRAGIEKIYAKAASLPDDTPMTDRDSNHASAKARQAFFELEELAAQHQQWRRLHRLLIDDDVQGELEQRAIVFMLFGDTKLQPPVWPSRMQPAEPAGPREPLARVRWLAKAESESWTPTAREINDRYFDGLPSRQLIETTVNKEK